MQGQFLIFEKIWKSAHELDKKGLENLHIDFLLNLLTKMEIWCTIVLVRISLYAKEEEERP